MMFAASATTNWFSDTESLKWYLACSDLRALYIDCVNARSLWALGATRATLS